MPSDLRYPDRTGETYAVTYHPNQRWYYFPKMQPDEAVLIRCFDSARSGAARFSAHGSFDDPQTPPGAPPRESIEVRTLVFFFEPSRFLTDPGRRPAHHFQARPDDKWYRAFAGMVQASCRARRDGAMMGLCSASTRS